MSTIDVSEFGKTHAANYATICAKLSDIKHLVFM